MSYTTSHFGLTALGLATVISACAATPFVHATSVPSPRSVERSVAGNDSVDFVTLPPGNVQRRDCVDATMPAGVCRVRRSVDASALKAAAAEGIKVIRNGDEITFLHQGPGEQFHLDGGIQYPMSRVVGTDLWVVTVRVPNASRATISYLMYSFESLKPGTRVSFDVWRGPEAPPAALKSVTLKGVVSVDTLTSKTLSRPRRVVVYTPPKRGDAPIAGVIYMGDGESAAAMAPYVDTLIVTGQLPRVLLVGIVTAMPAPGEPRDRDVRSMEYLLDYERGNAMFIAHERFLVDEVIPWAEQRFGAPTVRTQRFVYGISNSAGWAIDMGLRHPDIFSGVLAFSPGGRHGQIDPSVTFEPRVHFYLHGGTLEPAFHKIASDWAGSLASHGVDYTMQEVVGGHDSQVWADHFAEAVRWAIKASTR